jgi:RND family efflux transporter MFP subunit
VKSNAQVDVELVDGTKFTAEVIRRAPIVDAATGTVKFTVRASQFPAHAAPGAFARARVLVDAREAAPSLPRTAVFELEGKPHVYVIEDGKAHRRAVELGLGGEDAVEIVSGLRADDVVVSEGNSGITEGMPLAPAEPAADGG